LVKRVVIEGQWAVGTIADQYVADLHAAARSENGQVAIYRHGTDVVAAVLTPTRETVQPDHLGSSPERYVLVVYSAERGTLTTGYQVSSRQATSIPAEARWLR
jgi:hypothetical protein